MKVADHNSTHVVQFFDLSKRDACESSDMHHTIFIFPPPAFLALISGKRRVAYILDCKFNNAN
jgi:hypothetical protein